MEQLLDYWYIRQAPGVREEKKEAKSEETGQKKKIFSRKKKLSCLADMQNRG